jgi:hypothetical protein
MARPGHKGLNSKQVQIFLVAIASRPAVRPFHVHTPRLKVRLHRGIVTGW